MTYLFRKATMDHGMLYYTGRILPSMMERIRPQMSDSMFDLSRTSFCVPITDKYSDGTGGPIKNCASIL